MTQDGRGSIAARVRSVSTSALALAVVAGCAALCVGSAPATAAGPATVGAVSVAVVPTTADGASPERVVAAAVRTQPRSVTWAESKTRWPARTCLLFVRTALGVPRKYGSAQLAWEYAHSRHRTPISSIPAGVPVFTKGRSAAGHVVVSLGGGWVRSTDWPREGHVGTVRLTTLLATWKHHYLGWTADLNGVRIR